MHRQPEPLVSRASGPSADAPRGFGRRPAAGAAPATPRKTFDPPPLPPRATPAEKLARPGVSMLKRVFGLLLFVGGASVVYFMQFSTVGLPGCGAYDTRTMLTGMARDVLAKANFPYSRIDIAEAAAGTSNDSGVIKCTAQLVVDGQPQLRLVYEISWSVRLAVYNRWQVKIVSATP